MKLVYYHSDMGIFVYKVAYKKAQKHDLSRKLVKQRRVLSSHDKQSESLVNLDTQQIPQLDLRDVVRDVLVILQVFTDTGWSRWFSCIRLEVVNDCRSKAT